MPANAKIATCCYCGTRAVLTLCGETRHELACAACGAPLRAMKCLREPRPEHMTKAPPRRPKPRKRKRKPVWRKAFEEAFDALDDIFD